jgi:O-antigen/teichoic acid export membrane protein
MSQRIRRGASLRGPGLIAVAMGVMNIATYGFTMLAARLIGPQAYGAFASLMATLLVIGVLQLGLQATAARRISAELHHVATIERTVLGVTYRAALLLCLVLLVLTPAVNRVLRLESLTTAALVALTAAPLTMMGGQAGVLQGERRWGPLALVYVASGVPRLVIGTALILWHPDETNAMLGVALGAVAPVVVGWWTLRERREPGSPTEKHGFRDVLGETAHNSQALFAFFALSNADVVVARNVLHPHDVGLYAAGLILTKTVLFLPQFILVLAFPAMVATGERRRALARSLTACTGLGLCGTLGALALPRVALVFVGGSQYDEIGSTLWAFAVLGTVLSMLQLLVYSVLARQGRRSVYLVWAAFLCLVVAGSLVHTLPALLTVTLVTDASLFVALLALSLRATRHPEREAPAAVSSGAPST